MHLKKRTHECNESGRALRKKSHITQHLRAPKGKKTCDCSKCGENFHKEINLTQLQSTHTGEKPYECNECGKAFCQKSAPTVHQRTHTGEKPYNVMNAGDLSVGSPTFRASENSYGREILPMSWMWENFLWKVSKHKTSENSHRRKPYECTNVEKPSARDKFSTKIKEKHTRRKLSSTLSTCISLHRQVRLTERQQNLRAEMLRCQHI